MRKKSGFTLVELLVVMAIISILAAIAIPNVNKWIKKGKATSAIAEIKNMELAITKLLSDAGVSSIADLMDPTVLENAEEIGASMDAWTSADFDSAVDRYTNAVYALLRKGRGALGSDADMGDEESPGVNDVGILRESVVRNLGTSYMSALAQDPWGNLYQIYPGPWSPTNGLNPFRTYLAPPAGQAALPGDDLSAVDGDDLSLGSASTSATILTDFETGDDVELVGIPANNGQEVYIWSLGANLQSGQVRFLHPAIGAYDSTDGFDNYENTVQEPEFLGGGDDINNWDRENTFMRFYN